MRFVGSYNWCVDEKLEEMEVIFKSIYEKIASSHLEEPHELGYYTSVMQHAFALLPAPVRRMLCEEPWDKCDYSGPDYCFLDCAL